MKSKYFINRLYYIYTCLPVHICLVNVCDVLCIFYYIKLNNYADASDHNRRMHESPESMCMTNSDNYNTRGVLDNATD